MPLGITVDEFKVFVYENGTYWGIALVAVIVSKLYTEGEEQSVRSVVRSFVAAGLFTYLAVHYGIAHGYAAPTISLSVFFGSFLIDVIVELLMHIKKKVKEDPEGVWAALKNLWRRQK